MKVYISSEAEMKEIIGAGLFPKNTAVISFFDSIDKEYRIDYSDVCGEVFYLDVPDIYYDELSECSYTVQTYFKEVGQLAEFIIAAEQKKLDIICQCRYGQSRSAAAGAAIREFFFHDGIEIFADYRYCPNQLIFNKLLTALKER